MLSNVLRTGTAAAFLLAVAPFASTQQPVPAAAQPTVGQPAAATGNTFRAKQILGTKIMVENNTAVGTVDDIVFDNAGNLEYLIVAHDGKLTTVPWEAAKWDLKNQTGTLNITPQAYQTIPTYTQTTYPDFWAPAYRTQIYKTYNLTPRELRRLDRIVRP